MRFALLDTKNNSGLIAALKKNCVTIAQKGKSQISDIDVNTRSKIFEIAERNVTRRKIRFAKIFEFAPIAALYRAMYRRKCLASYAYFENALREVEPDCALVFNGYLAPNAVFELASKKLGIDILFLENGFFPNTMQADPLGINALSSLPKKAAFYDALTDEELGKSWPTSLVTRSSKLKQSDEKGEEAALPSDFIFVPFQVPSDMQILALSPWIKDMRHMFDEVFELARAFPHLNFVIKEHPSFPLSIQGTVEKRANIFFRNHDATQELIEASEGVLTVNSTVGLEALSLGKKVITLGEAHYAIEGVTLNATNREQLHAAVSGLDAWQPNAKRREAFVRFVFNQFLLPIRRDAPTSSPFDLLRQRAGGLDAYSRILKRAGESA